MNKKRMSARVNMLVLMGFDVKEATEKAFDEEVSYNELKNFKLNGAKKVNPVSIENNVKVIGLDEDGLSAPVEVYL